MGVSRSFFFLLCYFWRYQLYFSIKNKNHLYFSYLIICIFIFLSIAGKFSYNLSGFIIWVFATLKFITFKNFYRLFLITIFCFLLILCPFIYLKWINLGGSFFSYFFTPFPLHLPGYDIFLEHIRSPTYVKFPFFLFYNTSLSRISETLAFSIILLIFVIYNLNYKKIKNNDLIFFFLIIFFYFLISNLYASPNARYYFDVILWSALGIKFSIKN